MDNVVTFDEILMRMFSPNNLMFNQTLDGEIITLFIGYNYNSKFLKGIKESQLWTNTIITRTNSLKKWFSADAICSEIEFQLINKEILKSEINETMQIVKKNRA